MSPHGIGWDVDTPYTAPDTANRCFARSEPVRVFLLFSKDNPGARIAINHQRSSCYGDFQHCVSFQAKETGQEVGPAVVGSEN